MKLSDWKAETLRVSLFTTLAPAAEAAKLWAALAGRMSDRLTVSMGPGGVFSVSGEVEAAEGKSATLTVTRQADRLDLVWTLPYMVDEGGHATLVADIDVGSEFSRFLDRIERWSGESVACTRFAFGCTAIVNVQSKTQGYERLQELLPTVRLDPVGSSDFLYQINRPRPSSVLADSPPINRLSKWSVGQFWLAAPDSASGAKRLVGSKQMCRVELDISTSSQGTQALEPKTQLALLHEMTSLASELLEQGDVP